MVRGRGQSHRRRTRAAVAGARCYESRSVDALNKWWDGGGRDIQEKVGTKYATFRVLAIDGIEQK